MVCINQLRDQKLLGVGRSGCRRRGGVRVSVVREATIPGASEPKGLEKVSDCGSDGVKLWQSSRAKDHLADIPGYLLQF